MNKYGGKTGIRELNIDDFDLDTGKCITNNGKNGLIIFYQHWCPHCTDMVGEAIKANQMIGNKNVIFAVHGSAPTNKIVFDRFGIMGIPSIKFMNSYGRITNDYNGSRNAISFFDAIKENSKKDKEDITGTKIAQTVIMVEPIYIFFTRTVLILFLADK